MPNTITHSQIYVLDQDEALDFYVGKLGFEVNTDADLGFMRWLTVSFPGQPDRQILLEKPGPPAHDEATAEQVRELVTKGAMGMAAHLRGRRRPQDLRGAGRQGRRVHRGADRALLRHRLRPARPVRQPPPDRHAQGGPDRDARSRRVRRRERPLNPKPRRDSEEPRCRGAVACSRRNHRATDAHSRVAIAGRPGSWPLDHRPRDGGRLAAGEEPSGRGGGQRHADDREGEVEDRHVTQIAEVVVVRRGEERRRRRRRRAARRAGRARRRWWPSACGGCGRWLRSRSGCGGHRRSRCGSARRSARGCRAPAARPRPWRWPWPSRGSSSSSLTSIVRPASAARRRASAIWSLVRGRLDSTSQPAGICFQPWRRRPSSVMKHRRLRSRRSPTRTGAGRSRSSGRS